MNQFILISNMKNQIFHYNKQYLIMIKCYFEQNDPFEIDLGSKKQLQTLVKRILDKYDIDQDESRIICCLQKKQQDDIIKIINRIPNDMIKQLYCYQISQEDYEKYFCTFIVEQDIENEYITKQSIVLSINATFKDLDSMYKYLKNTTTKYNYEYNKGQIISFDTQISEFLDKNENFIEIKAVKSDQINILIQLNNQIIKQFSIKRKYVQKYPAKKVYTLFSENPKLNLPKFVTQTRYYYYYNNSKKQQNSIIPTVGSQEIIKIIIEQIVNVTFRFMQNEIYHVKVNKNDIKYMVPHQIYEKYLIEDLKSGKFMRFTVLDKECILKNNKNIKPQTSEIIVDCHMDVMFQSTIFDSQIKLVSSFNHSQIKSSSNNVPITNQFNFIQFRKQLQKAVNEKVSNDYLKQVLNQYWQQNNKKRN